jgi:uncharacterized protein
MSEETARAYVRWVQAHTVRIFLITALAVMASMYLAARNLPLDADLAALLPADAQSVRDLRRIEARVPAHGAVLTLVVAPTAELSAIVAAELAAAYRQVGPDLIADVEADDTETRAFYRKNLFLFAPVADLHAARDRLADEIRKHKLAANPLYIDLDDDLEAEPSADEALQRLGQRRRDLEAQLAQSSFVSSDGRLRMVIARTAFSRTDLGQALRLRGPLLEIRDQILARPGREQVQIGLTGTVFETLIERVEIERSMFYSAALTGVLVIALLVLYYRSAKPVILLTAALAVGVLVSFGFAAVLVGHLNIATAFLTAIVAGNGVNFGLLLLARYEEERRVHSLGTADALASAIFHTARPTMVASLGAAVAYGSLAVTSFPGFSEFAVIGGVGILVCWIAAFTTLPALIVVFDTRTAVPPARTSLAGQLSASVGATPLPAVGLLIAVLLGWAGWTSYQYIRSDPFEYDVTQLRTADVDSRGSRRWKRLSHEHFGRDVDGFTYIAADRRDLDRGRPWAERRIGEIRSIEHVLPSDQPEKLAALAEIADLLADPALATLDEEKREELAALRPPADLTQIAPEDVPDELFARLRERDGRVGLLLTVRPGPGLEMWDGQDLVKFTSAIRKLHLADGSTVTTSGAAIILSDIIEFIRRDGPYATLAAGMGALILVLAVIGFNRRAVAVLLSTGLGTLCMIAIVAHMGIKVHFLDFVALPITLGLGLDYAVNIAMRSSSDTGHGHGAVVVCSLTTIIAYGSLLVSANGAVRSFGLASLIGEVCCIVLALIVVPPLARRPH